MSLNTDPVGSYVKSCISWIDICHKINNKLMVSNLVVEDAYLFFNGENLFYIYICMYVRTYGCYIH